MLTAQARLFLERFEARVAHIHAVWDAAIAAAERVPARRARPAKGRPEKVASGDA